MPGRFSANTDGSISDAAVQAAFLIKAAWTRLTTVRILLEIGAGRGANSGPLGKQPSKNQPLGWLAIFMGLSA
jgi:hypothetical protein